MRSWLAILGLMLGMMVAFASSVQSQGPGAGATIAFRNETKSAVIIQGISSIAGMIRRGQPVLVAAGRVGGDYNVPAGPRVYSVYDANQPSRVLAKDVPVMTPAAGVATFAVRMLPTNQVVLIPDTK